MSNIQKFIQDFQASVDFQQPIDVLAETRLAELPEWDSLAALGVIVMFDIEYGKTITGDHLKSCETIQDLFNLLG